MLEVHNLSFAYHNKEVISSVNMHIKPGEIVGLCGASGLGKTTLAKLLTGYLKPNEGFVSVDKKPAGREGFHPVQLIWQHPEKAINPRWKMKKVIDESGALDKEIIEVLGIKPIWLNRYPSQLSGGELQRFCVARVFTSQTKYIVADEITTMLDAVNQAQIWQAILQLAEEREIGILAISHNQTLLEKICNRLIDFEEDFLK